MYPYNPVDLLYIINVKNICVNDFNFLAQFVANARELTRTYEKLGTHNDLVETDLTRTYVKVCSQDSADFNVTRLTRKSIFIHRTF